MNLSDSDRADVEATFRAWGRILAGDSVSWTWVECVPVGLRVEWGCTCVLERPGDFGREITPLWPPGRLITDSSPGPVVLRGGGHADVGCFRCPECRSVVLQERRPVREAVADEPVVVGGKP